MTEPTPELVTTLPRLRPRRPDGHKGDYGRALLVGGSRGMSGAIALAGMSALRGGAGLVRLAIPDACLDTVAAYEPSYMTTALPSDPEGRLASTALDALSSHLEVATCVACGPGLGRSTELTTLVRQLYRSLDKPLVVDADALNALAADGQDLSDHAGPRILTPHPGEFRRLAGAALARESGEQEMSDAAVEMARRHSIVVVLKGHRTLVTDGHRVYRNTTGNPGMATGGSGDVLTGLITALVCQSLASWDAARLGVFLHGRAGDLAARRLGQVSLIASDLVAYMPRAFRSLDAGPTSASPPHFDPE